MESVIHTTIPNELSQGKTVIFHTVGASMEPLLRERQTHVILQKADYCSAGDILLFVRASGELVLHRLVKIKDRYYFLRGDNTYYKEKIHKSCVIGRVSMIYKEGKYIDVFNDKAYLSYVKKRRLLYPFRYIIVSLKRILKKIIKSQR